MTDSTGRTLRGFTGAGYDKGRPLSVQAAWFAVQHLLFRKWWLPARLARCCCARSAPTSDAAC